MLQKVHECASECKVFFFSGQRNVYHASLSLRREKPKDLKGCANLQYCSHCALEYLKKFVSESRKRNNCEEFEIPIKVTFKHTKECQEKVLRMLKSINIITIGYRNGRDYSGLDVV